VRLVSSGAEWTVGRELGAGGEGRVYEALGPGGNKLALKWYHPERADQVQWDTLETLIDYGAPHPRFVWPLDLAVASKPGGRRAKALPEQWGYVMSLYDARFRDVNAHLQREVKPGFRALARAGVGLADGFLQLHTKGLCYRDISEGNVVFDPITGDVLIADNDNVGIDGEVPRVAGTPGFMAPEVVRGEAVPSTRTDRFSLAVLLFLMFMINHPFFGRKEFEIDCLDDTAFDRLVGFEPVFIFDPDDESNRPVPGVHDNAIQRWSLYPRSVRSLFIRSFTDGLHDPAHGRVAEVEWRGALAQLHDTVVQCPVCGHDNFAPDAPDGHFVCCNSQCGTRLKRPLWLDLGRNQVALAAGAELFPHHLVKNRRFDYGTALARIEEHPKYDARGLTNLSDRSWTVTSDGESFDVPSGSALMVAAGTSIDFGGAVGAIRG
jgi:DNA-binding helix-hairpin-helix protein with protein kinase domain